MSTTVEIEPLRCPVVVAAEVTRAWVILPPAIGADMTLADIVKAMILNSRLARKGRAR